MQTGVGAQVEFLNLSMITCMQSSVRKGVLEHHEPLDPLATPLLKACEIMSFVHV